MFAYNEIRERKYIVLEDTPYEVLSSSVSRKQQRKPVNQTKLRNLVTKKVTERAFHKGDTVKEAEIDTKKIKYLYNNKNEYWFCEENDPSKRFSIKDEIVGSGGKFIKENSIVDVILFGDTIIGIKIPIKIDLKVKEAPPSDRGNTAQGGNKQVILETGAIMNVPLFINEGDMIRINTESEEYTERVQ
jgi:elongation factor P